LKEIERRDEWDDGDNASGLKTDCRLDLNKLIRDGFAKQGEKRQQFISWMYIATGEALASGFLTSELSGPRHGWMRLRLGALDQQSRFSTSGRFRGFQRNRPKVDSRSAKKSFSGDARSGRRAAD
jgi:hypothetical protein